MAAMRFVRDLSERRVDDAARMWAEATAARDHDSVAPLARARTVVTNAIDESGDPLLLTALDLDGQALGFALALPSGDSGAELRFLGVVPTAWGRGVATALLDELTVQVRASGSSAMQLWVYEDNERAVAVYERSGWRPDGATRTHPRSGKLERLYVRRAPSA